MGEYWKMTKNGMDSYIFPLDNLENAIIDMDDSEPGVVWSFEVIVMDDEEFENLPEFEGW